MTQDVRKIKTERDLQNAFLQLLTTKGFRHLTVADICQASLTSRSTFYAHYLDKYDLLDQLVAHYTAVFASRVDLRFDQMITGKIDALVQGLLADMAENRAAIQILFTVHEPEADLQANFKMLLLKKWQAFITARQPETAAPVALIAAMGTNVQMTLIEWVIAHGEAAIDGVADAVNTIREAVLLQIDTD
ncbi:TetR/AcrR family transcriptional regulator [Lactiplantibacillus sp. WILCCON 0030]|uniref:TetR/AcrR family transcriptional regulator n=1 Tax=Lactiplantibacillus brownii TaxID=3069269 RepID=A0ABU1A8W4_9LACO|nr:TetR/AcrR family transcriptional regulator [Lactiplantibacillus brownii]MDQ7937359.1 TetR/AcrR family transcriptional regulator [Lactiplantibacillus brownii]